MATFLSYGLYVAIAALFIVLIMGLVNLTRSDEGQASRSNKLMRMRVLIQFIVVIMLVLLGIVFGSIRLF